MNFRKYAKPFPAAFKEHNFYVVFLHLKIRKMNGGLSIVESGLTYFFAKKNHVLPAVAWCIAVAQSHNFWIRLLVVNGVRNDWLEWNFKFAFIRALQEHLKAQPNSVKVNRRRLLAMTKPSW